MLADRTRIVQNVRQKMSKKLYLHSAALPVLVIVPIHPYLQEVFQGVVEAFRLAEQLVQDNV